MVLQILKKFRLEQCLDVSTTLSAGPHSATTGAEASAAENIEDNVEDGYDDL